MALHLRSILLPAPDLCWKPGRRRPGHGCPEYRRTALGWAVLALGWGLAVGATAWVVRGLF